MQQYNQLQGMATRINRYIMECKFAISASNSAFSTELIDTLWNVNKSVVREYRKVTKN